jgi:hypothetical protein
MKLTLSSDARVKMHGTFTTTKNDKTFMGVGCG